MPSVIPKIDSPTEHNAPSQPVERIVLTGFMGSGKSTIGRGLAERLGWRFIDLDTVIEERDSRTVARIFAESGEPIFRAKETEALLSSLQQSRVVIALGGGALDTPANRQALGGNPSLRVVLLTAEFETLFRRCQEQIAAAAGSALPVRPLLGDRKAAAARMARRDPIYREAAHIVLDTTGQQPDQSVAELFAILASIV